MKEFEAIYKSFRTGSRIITDSREVKEGDIFIALKGENHNGNTFAEKAIAQGAKHVIIDEAAYDTAPQCMLVPDTLKFLQQLANHHRKQLHIPILGITGTNGKTTTKELCHAVLLRKYNTVATQGNFNNHIGVPLTLLSMNETTEFGIVEMGANHPGEIEELCKIAEPDYGIITNIGFAHLEGFMTYENIVNTKNALYKAVKEKQGMLFVNGDDELLCRLSANQKRYTYGIEGHDVNGEIAQATPFVYTLKTRHGNLYIRTKLIGRYNFDNAMAASALGIYFNIDPVQIQSALEAYTPSNMRSQLLKTERNTIILDAYNANPSSMQAAIANFAEITADNKLPIFGEMRELGAIFSKKAHREVIELLVKNHFTQAFLVGHNFESLANDYTFTTYFPDTEALIEHLKTNKITNAFILIKGSRRNKLERITEYL